MGTGTINIIGGTLDTTATNYAGTAPQLGNAAVNLYQGGALALNDSAVTTVTGTSNTGVTWALDDGDPGTIDSNGLYTAAATLGDFHVTAISMAIRRSPSAT